MKTQFGIITRNGFNLQYIVEGEGEPVLVIGSRLFYQRLFSPALKQKLKFIFFDHRGFTPAPFETSNPEELYGLHEILADMEALRVQLGIEKWWVAGHSGHGFMALEYAKKYDNRALGVILIGMSPDFSTSNHAITDLHFDTIAEPERVQAFKNNQETLKEKLEAEPENRFILVNQAQAPKSWRNLQLDTTVFWEGVYINTPAIDYLWGLVFRDIDITREMEDFYMPVWLGLGKYDFVAGPKEQWEPITKFFQDLTIELFENSAHNPSYEETDLFDQKLLDWMELYK